ncbi:MAG: response regulator [bacterium]
MMKILIVDDEATLRVALAGLFQLDGYTVVVCGSGKEALSKWTDDITHVVSDVQMPGISGVELAQSLLEKKPELKLVLYTGNKYIFKTLPKNICGLQKPVAFQEIKDALDLK